MSTYMFQLQNQSQFEDRWSWHLKYVVDSEYIKKNF